MKILPRILLLFSFILWFQFSISAQSGMLFSYGISTTNMQHTEGAHGGIQAGFDLIIEDYTFFILPGIHYFRMHLNPGEKGMIFEPSSTTLDGVKFKLNFGKRIGNKYKDMQGRIFIGGNVVYANDISKESKARASIDDFNAIHFSGNLGARFMYKFLSVTANYELGLQDVYKITPNSRAKTFTLTLGLFL